MAKGSGGGAGGSGGRKTPKQVAISDFGGRSNPDGSITLSASKVEDAIGLTVKRRSTGSIDSASIDGQRISANSVSSVQYSVRNVRLEGTEIVVRRVGGQANVGEAYKRGISKIASKIGKRVTVRWIG